MTPELRDYLEDVTNWDATENRKIALKLIFEILDNTKYLDCYYRNKLLMAKLEDILVWKPEE